LILIFRKTKENEKNAYLYAVFCKIVDMINRRLLRIKILQILYAHFNADEPSILKSEKDLLFSIQKAYDLYYYIFLLIIAIRRYAETRIELARNKKLPTFEDLNPNTRFVENSVIRQIEKNQSFNHYLNETKMSWVNHPELIRSLYNKLVESSYYQKYMENSKNNYRKDRRLVVDFFSNELENFEMFYDILEEQSIFWNDDIDFVIVMVIKVIQNMRVSKLEFHPMYKSDEDQEFAIHLLRKIIINHNEYRQMIEDYVVNWDIERIALIDSLIIQLAINELTDFPFIPVKVTFDEYLELAKYYSTPKSSVFINGLLDKISADLTEQGKIVKTGKGLIDEL